MPWVRPTACRRDWAPSSPSSGRKARRAVRRRSLVRGLLAPRSVTFNAVPAAFRIVSDTYLTATVPAEAGNGRVVMVTPSGSLTSNKNFIVR